MSARTSEFWLHVGYLMGSLANEDVFDALVASGAHPGELEELNGSLTMVAKTLYEKGTDS